MIRGISSLLFLICIISVTSAYARKMDLTKMGVAPYFKGDFGTSSLHQNAFDRASGEADIAEKVRFQYGGSLGVLIATKSFGLRLGVQGLYPQKIDAVVGKAPGSDIELFNLTSTVVGVIPVAHLEFNFDASASGRVAAAVGVGAGTVTLMNDFKFTPIGAAAYSMVDFVEEGRANVIMYESSLGYEFILTDNVGLMTDVGYRYLIAKKFKHVRDATTFSGPVNKGEAVKNIDDSDRELNMSSIFLGLAFRFYIN